MNDSLINLKRGLRKTYKGILWKLGLWTFLAVLAECVAVDLASSLFQISALGGVTQRLMANPVLLGTDSHSNPAGPMLLKLGGLIVFALAVRIWLGQRCQWQAERISSSIAKELRNRLFRESHRTSGMLIAPESAQTTQELIEQSSARYARAVADKIRCQFLNFARLLGGLVLIGLIRWDWAIVIGTGSGLFWFWNRQSLNAKSQAELETAPERDRQRKLFQEEMREAYQARAVGSDIGNGRPSIQWINNLSSLDQSVSSAFDSIRQTSNWGRLAILGLVIFLLGASTAAQSLSPGSTIALLCLASAGLLILNLTHNPRLEIQDGLNQILPIHHALSSSVRLWDLSDSVAMQPCRSKIQIESLPLGLGPEDPRSQILLSANIPARKVTAIVCPDILQRRKLMRMIARWEDPQSGRVLVDGVDLRNCTIASTRLQIGTIRSDSYVNTGTILHNITLKDPRGDLLSAIEAAKEVHAHRMIQRLPNGYQTWIDLEKSDEETLYSRFLIALARGKWHDPSILLVEEPSPGMSRSMREFLRDSYRRLARDRTLVIFTRHSATVLAADYVILISPKKVVQGSPKNLLKTHSGFRRAMAQMGLGLKQKVRSRPKVVGSPEETNLNQT